MSGYVLPNGAPVASNKHVVRVTTVTRACDAVAFWKPFGKGSLPRIDALCAWRAHAAEHHRVNDHVPTV